MENRPQLQTILTNLGSVFKSERQKLGISQEELAHRSGLHRTYITDVERGVRNLTLESMLKLAGALDVALSHVFTKVDGRLNPSASPDAPGSVSTTVPARGVNILVVDDDANDVELTRRALEKHGVANAISVSTNGNDALNRIFPKQAGNSPPDLVLLDLRLPDVDGLEILRRMRGHERTKQIPVVVLTASRSDQDYEKCLELGVTAFVSKPIGFPEFSEQMSSIGCKWLLIGKQ